VSRGSRPTAAEVEAATPAHRDRYVDFLRAASLAVVVVGHWLMAAVEYHDGRLGATNVLRDVPPARLLTWALQVMPLFFFVGGFANSASWSAARRDGASYGAWLGSRVRRMVRPAAAYAVVWTLLAATLAAADVGNGTVATLDKTVALPLWFLAVYLVVVALAPALLAAHRRLGWAVPVALAAGVAVVDLAHWTVDVPVVGWANFVLVWLFAHQLGFLWRDGRLPARAVTGWALAGAGLAALVVLTGPGPYPVSLVGGMGEARTNTDPPSLALVAATLLQVGLALAVRRSVDPVLARPRAWAVVVGANRVAMTVYLWHLTALVAVSALVLPRGWFPSPERATAAWWAWRPAWLAVLAAAVVPLVALFARVERARRPHRRTTPSGAAVVAGALVSAAGMAVLALHGFSVPGAPLELPVVGIGLLAAGGVLTGLRGPNAATGLRGPNAVTGLRGPNAVTGPVATRLPAPCRPAPVRPERSARCPSTR
jgi:fucose 4-O-acetylase-like acetyltransferase